MSRVVVIGGGYAGLACLIELAKKDRHLELHLIDAQADHCKITNLHKTFVKPIETFRVPYQQLAEQFKFNFHQQQLAFTLLDLKRWQEEKSLPLGEERLSFDWLVVSTGATSQLQATAADVVGLQSLRRGDGKTLLEKAIANYSGEKLELSLIGGGATGIQVLFELREVLRRKRIPHQLRLVDLNPRVVPHLPDGVPRYIVRKMRREGIDYLPETSYISQCDGQVQLQEQATGREYSLSSDLTLLFPGVAASPTTLETNAYGQVTSDGQELSHIFSAGDCSKFDSFGLNFLTAQAAVRKGKLVAGNILKLAQGEKPRSYRYQEKGYLISLGAFDAVGWVGLRCNLAKGFPANILKEAMESQYDLFLKGVDTYVGFP
ncbi:MAG: FAD-dependent oxidoreductase [Deltaproteobacteria bacterium]|jgi:NADH dehydrogenase|nr:FAD-dependent oxidoreductase [Deltaproteobacteria bacterium]